MAAREPTIPPYLHAPWVRPMPVTGLCATCGSAYVHVGSRMHRPGEGANEAEVERFACPRCGIYVDCMPQSQEAP